MNENNNEHLKHETKITWMEDPSKYPYVREKVEHLSFRSRFPMRGWKESKTLKLIGYSEISVLANQIFSGFYRRIWYIKLRHDPYESGSPGEGVKPSSIMVGKASDYGRES